MRTFEFTRSILSDDPGWEMDIYQSNDINGRYGSERACMLAILTQEGVIGNEDTNVFDDWTLESLLLENNIYVCFVEE